MLKKKDLCIHFLDLIYTKFVEFNHLKIILLLWKKQYFIKEKLIKWNQ